MTASNVPNKPLSLIALPVVWMLALSACGGVISSHSDDTPAAVDPELSASELLPQRIWRLTEEEYRASIYALLGDEAPPALGFAHAATGDGFSNAADALAVDPLLAEQLVRAAEPYASHASERAGANYPCVPPACESEACAHAFVERCAEAAFRRMPAEDEVDRLMGVYQAGATEGVASGLELALTGILIAPQFIYRSELGDATTESEGRILLTHEEVATALAFTVTGAPPDEELRQSASAKELRDPDIIEGHVRRLYNDSRPRMRQMFAEWFELEELGSIYKDPAVYSEFSPELLTSMQGSFERFIDYALYEADGRLDTLFVDRHAYVDRKLSGIYGVEPPSDDDFHLVELDPSERAGLLTRAEFQTFFSHPNKTSPVRRGTFVWRKVLCQTIGDPPPSAQVAIPEPNPEQTTLEAINELTMQDGCASCHTFINSAGTPFERYDALGRWRELDNNNQVQASAELVGSFDMAGDVTGPIEMSQKLAASAAVHDCFLQHYLSFMMGTTAAGNEEGALRAAAHAAFAERDRNVLETLVGMARSSAFITRATEGGLFTLSTDQKGL